MEAEAIRIAFSGGEVILKGVVQATPQLIAFIKAALEKEKLAGKTGFKNMLRNEVRPFTLGQDDYKKFTELAKEYGILYQPVGHTVNSQQVDFMVRSADVEKCNMLFERLGIQYREAAGQQGTDVRESVKEKIENLTREKSPAKDIAAKTRDVQKTIKKRPRTGREAR